MHFFGKKDDDGLAIDKVHQWLIDTEKSTPESLGDTSIARLSKQASAELNMPQSTTIHALYDLRDSGKLLRIKGTNQNASFNVKPITTKNVSQKTIKDPVTESPEAFRVYAPPVRELGQDPKCAQKPDPKCAQKEPKVCVKNGANAVTITIKIDF